MQYEQFKNLASDFTAVPVYRRLMADVLTPVSLFMKIRENSRYPFLLESVEGGEQLARYSFLGRDPYQILRYENGKVTLQKGDQAPEKLNESYFEALKRLTTVYREPTVPELPRLTGGAVGFSSYDTVRDVEHLPDSPDDDLNLPEAIWAFYDEVFAFDHVKQQVIIIKTIFPGEGDDPGRLYDQALQRLDELEERVREPIGKTDSFDIHPDRLQSNMEREKFETIVEKAKEYI